MGINIDFDSEFKQILFKLANTYKAEFELNSNFENIEDYSSAVSEAISDDFSKQLKPLIKERIIYLVNQQMK